MGGLVKKQNNGFVDTWCDCCLALYDKLAAVCRCVCIRALGDEGFNAYKKAMTRNVSRL
jgi:hypothetical protein